VPPAPQGWTYVNFDPESATSGCSNGYDNPTPLEQTPTAGNQCTCTCGNPQKNPCTQGMENVMYGFLASPGACNGLGVDTIALTITGDCDNIGHKIGKSPGNNIFQTGEIAALPPVQVPCDAPVPQPPTLTATPGRACAPNALGDGCTGGGTCLPTVNVGLQCIQLAGNNNGQCPAEFDHTRYIVYAPADVVDNRTCAACTCNTTATTCTMPTFTTYAANGGNDCPGNGNAVTVDGNCDNLPNGSDNSNDDHFIYDAMATTTCIPAQTMVPVQNMVQLPTATTICCQ